MRSTPGGVGRCTGPATSVTRAPAAAAIAAIAKPCLPRRTVGDVAHRVDRLVGRAGGHQHMLAIQRAMPGIGIEIGLARERVGQRCLRRGRRSGLRFLDDRLRRAARSSRATSWLIASGRSAARKTPCPWSPAADPRDRAPASRHRPRSRADRESLRHRTGRPLAVPPARQRGFPRFPGDCAAWSNAE